jgi:gamma-glutamyl-gamma-aminobutyrate hydrolase PuuD
MFRGGKDLGSHFLSSIKEDPAAAQFGGYDDLADSLDAKLMQAALSSEKTFPIGICRGYEQVVASLTQLPPQPVSHHAPIPGENEMLSHPVFACFSQLYGKVCPIDLPKLTQVNSFHHLGYTLYNRT